VQFCTIPQFFRVPLCVLCDLPFALRTSAQASTLVGSKEFELKAAEIAKALNEVDCS
jgi:hypothetical protein